MKARLLKSLLNNTLYSISNNEKYIAVGSPMCHNLFSVDKKTLEVKYAGDSFKEGRKYLLDKSNTELLFIFDKLTELVENGMIQEIINGNDEIENPLPVYTVRDGRLVKSFTDKYGWPNTDHEGYTMYGNTHFDNPQQAIEYGIKEYGYAEKSAHDNYLEQMRKAKESRMALMKYRTYLLNLKKIKSSLL